MPPFASVIILNWNGREFLSECLQSVREQTYTNLETIVVDNGSTDGSQQYIKSCFPNVKLVELAENRGFCGGNNAGFRKAQGEFIALLNNDTRVSPKWLESLCDALDRHPDAGSAASKMVLYDHPNIIDAAGDVFYWVGVAAKRGHGCRDDEHYAEEEYVFGACAGAALYRRKMLEEIGFLDEDFFIYDEDVDLSFRAQLANWKCIYVPSAVVRHRVSATMARTSTRSMYLIKRNNLWVLLKNMPGSLLLRYGMVMLMYHSLSDLRAMTRGYVGAVMRGRWDAWRAWQQIRTKRDEIQRRRKISDRELMRVMMAGRPPQLADYGNSTG